MKTKKGLKRIVALVMCVVLLATSLPIALAANGEYSPAPYFTPEAQKEGAAAWINSDNGVTIRFPLATAKKTWNDKTQKTIQFYLIELLDLGVITETHQEKVIFSKKFVPDAVAAEDMPKVTTMLTASECGVLDISSHRYSVRITAVDSDNWFSQAMAATVSDVPEYEPTADMIVPLTVNEKSTREILRFEGKNSNSSNYSDNGVGGRYDYISSGDAIQMLGQVRYGGEEAADTRVKTTAYGFRTTNVSPTPENPQSFCTGWSRQHWDISGAQEIWYYMDLSTVELTGLSFQLNANSKVIWEWQGYKKKPSHQNSVANNDRYSPITYSTLGYTGDDAYVYIQHENGLWKKVSMQNGTIDLSHYKGYIRVPIEFICSTEASYVDASNQNLNNDQKSMIADAGLGRKFDQAKKNTYPAALAYFNSRKLSDKVMVDPAGTPISDALLIQGYKFHCAQYRYLEGDYDSFQFPNAGNLPYDWCEATYGTIEPEYLTMLAPGLDDNNNDIATMTGGKAAYIENGEVKNRATGWKAVDDIFGAGFAFTGMSESSKESSFYLDNVLAYRTDNNAYDYDTDVNGGDGSGILISKYYDQTTEMQNIILDKIDEYISAPDLSDYRAVSYIEDLMADYRNHFEGTTIGTDFLNEDNIRQTAINGGREATWQKFIDARQACKDAGTYGQSNSETYSMVPQLVQKLEKMAPVSEIKVIDDQVVADVQYMYNLYRKLNVAQTVTFGAKNEKKLLEYFSLVRRFLQSNEVVVGQQLANFPYIPFNDFEQNTTVGEKSWMLEHDTASENASTVQSDYRHTKGLVTFTLSDGKRITEVDSGIDATYTTKLYNATWANITQDGFAGTKGATVSIDSGYSSGLNTGAWHVLNVSKDTKSAADFAAFSGNNMSGAGLGTLAKTYSDSEFASGNSMPLSIVLYVDFSEMTDFNFAVNIYTKDSSGNLKKARPDMGLGLSDAQKLWRIYYILNPETGEWVRMQGDNRWEFTSTSKTDNGLSLNNYRGYIAIPLQHFKTDATVSSTQLNEHADLLNNIYAVQLAIGSSEASYGKSYTVDNIGFTYDPVYYADVLQGRTDRSYAEYFHAKSLPAARFEEAVAAIDPYNEADFATKVAEAQAMYENLGPYQKTSIESVRTMKQRLDLYASYIDGSKAKPQPVLSPEALIAKLNALPDTLKTATITGDKELPYPGYVDGEVNYAAYGLTKELAEEILTWRSDSYECYSPEQKALFTEDVVAIYRNAYNAAMRCNQSLGDAITQADLFYNTLITGDRYQEYELRDSLDKVQMVKFYDREAAIVGAYNTYKDVSYLTKYVINHNLLGGDNMSKAATNLYMWLQNTQTFTTSDGEKIKSGEETFWDKAKAVYTDAKTALDAKELLKPELVERVRDVIGEYNAWEPVYANTVEIYNTIHDIIELFGVYDVSFDNGTNLKEINLDEGVTESEFALNVNYAEELPSDSDDCYTYFTVAYDGIMHNASDNSEGANLEFYWNGTKVAVGSEDSPVRIPADMNGGGALKNNQYTAAAPRSIDLKTVVKGSSVEPTSGHIVIKQYRAKKGAELKDATTPDPLVNTYTVVVNTAASEGYFVRIPADVPVDWGASEADVSYSVSCALDADSKILVNVAGASVNAENKGALTNAGTDKSIAYTAVNFTASEFTGTQNAKKPDLLPKLEIAAEAWQNIPVARYEDTLTYTVTYNKTQTP